MASSARAIAVIPARWASSRLPGKMLTPIGGRPLVHWVIDRVLQAKQISKVLLATDDERIAAACADTGARVLMTRADHPSGTDRIAEAAAAEPAADIIINVQGDEPLIDPTLIDQLAHTLAAEPELSMITAAVRMDELAEVSDPAAVKVVVDAQGNALYFSRAPIPWQRDGADWSEARAAGLMRRHLGIYGYRREFLQRFVQTPPAPLENCEKLEQLRALHLGAKIRVLDTSGCGPGVDTPEDVIKAEAALREAGLVI